MGTVTVRLFARLAEVAGTRTMTLELGEGLIAGDVFAILAEKHPAAKGLATNVMYAVNQVYVPASEPLRDGDELAIIPPVSGGSHAV